MWNMMTIQEELEVHSNLINDTIHSLGYDPKHVVSRSELLGHGMLVALKVATSSI